MESWKKIYSAEELQTLQRTELYALDELERVCRELNLSYFMYGGSLIGAIKYQGFVPWDDDIDVAMMRKDYELLLRKAQSVLLPQFVLQTAYSDRKSPYPYAKLRIKGTVCAEYGCHKLNIEKGIYIDIYPIDHLPDSELALKKQHKAFQRLARLYVCRQCPYPGKQPDGIRDHLRNTMKLGLSSALKCVPGSWFVKRMDRIATQFNNTPVRRYGNYYHATPVNVFSSIFPLQKGVFSGRNVNLPCDWEGFLRKRYGNYEDLPPEEKRIGHKPVVLDFGPFQ